MDEQQAEGTVLSGGLRRVLIGAILVGCALAAIQVIAVSKLQHEIGHWAWTSQVDTLRERLWSRSLAELAGTEETRMAEVVVLFDALREATEQDVGSAEHTVQATRLSEMEREARNLFLSAIEGRTALEGPREAIRQNVDLLQSMSVSLATQVRAEEQSLRQTFVSIDERFQEINELKATLSSVMISAQVLQQQVIAIQRLIGAASDEIISSSVASLRANSLPSVCASDEDETGSRICSPSVSRVLSAMDRLQDGDSSAIPQNINLTLQGLQGYIRAGQGRLEELSIEEAEVLGQIRELRQRQSEIGEMNLSLSRINRPLLDIGIRMDQPFLSVSDLEETNGRFRSYASQISLRMTGLLNNHSILEGDPELVAITADAVLNDWTLFHDIASAQIVASTAFEERMEALSAAIMSHASEVRRDTMLWVNLYASSFLFLAGVLIASTISLVLLARRRFINPLVRVTGTIIGLARGDLHHPVALPERAFGFDRLGKALEQLRQEMVERHLLAERNAEQQKIIASNLAELERTNQEMEWLAMHDPLTGLANRRQADLDLVALTEGETSSRTDFCVMQVDIDRFKTINDTLGHAAGDFVLKAVTQILESCVGLDANCYRIGGDEFLIVWFGDHSSEEAAFMAENIIKQIEIPMDFEGHRCNVGASIGIALGRTSGFDALQGVINADLALHSAKLSGRGAYKFFNEELAVMSSRRQLVSDLLIAAMEDRSFLPFYQPQFDAKTRDLRGVEVLCRWHHADLGWISPGEFLQVAEELEAVGRIDEILFDKVSDDLNELSEMGFSIPKVSFNVTADRLLKSGFAADLSSKIGPHARIAVELLESMTLDDPSESVRWAIDQLREHGIDVEIDDFGSYRASLAGLMAVNPQAMKIDRSIVIPIVDSARHLNLVKKIIDIGVALNVEVVAEGVETEEHAERLSALGCGVLQGFGLARPMPFDDLVEFCVRRAEDSTLPSNAVA